MHVAWGKAERMESEQPLSGKVRPDFESQSHTS